MNKLRLDVRFFTTLRDGEPVRDWLKTLSQDDKKTIGEDIKTVQLGWPLGMPLVRKMEVNLWEVRISLKSRIARILFTVVDNTMVLLHGFIKKSDKTPISDIELARKRLKALQEAQK